VAEGVSVDYAALIGKIAARVDGAAVGRGLHEVVQRAVAQLVQIAAEKDALVRAAKELAPNHAIPAICERHHRDVAVHVAVAV